jgi:cation diffusion facilitator family transporter
MLLMTNQKALCYGCLMEHNEAQQPHGIAHTVEPRVDATAGDAQDTSRVVKQLTAVGVLGNVALSLFKLIAGIWGNSAALVSDAVHSASDVLTTVIAFAGARIAMKDADVNHPYGHDRFEQLAALLLALILAAAGIGIGIVGLRTILSGQMGHGTPGIIALVAAAVSIVTKEAMFWYTRHGARKIASDAFMADAWHHRSDALSSVASLAGVAAARMGYPLGDPLAAIIICAFILKVAFDVARDAIGKLVDETGGTEVEGTIASCAHTCDGVDHVDSIVTRRFGSTIYADVEVAMDGNLSLDEAHQHAEAVHDTIEHEIPEVKHVTVRVNPAQPS